MKDKRQLKQKAGGLLILPDKFFGITEEQYNITLAAASGDVASQELLRTAANQGDHMAQQAIVAAEKAIYYSNLVENAAEGNMEAQQTLAALAQTDIKAKEALDIAEKMFNIINQKPKSKEVTMKGPRITEIEKLGTQIIEGERVRKVASKFVPETSSRKKHPNDLTKKQIQEYFKRWSKSKDLTIKEQLENGIQFRIEKLNESIEKTRTGELEKELADKAKYESQIVHARIDLENLRTRSQKDTPEYEALTKSINRTEQYLEKGIYPKIAAINKKINTKNGLITFYQSLFQTITADNMVDDLTTEKILQVVGMEEDNSGLDDLLANLMGMKIGGKKTKRGGGDCAGPVSIPALQGEMATVVSAVAEDAISQPASIEGGKKKRVARKQKGGEIVPAAAEDAISQPASIEGGKKKRVARKQKGGEIVPAAAEDAISQPASIEGGKKKRVTKK